MKPIPVTVQVSSFELDVVAATLLILGRYPMAEVLSTTPDFASISIDLRYLESLTRWVPSSIMLETHFRKGDVVLYYPAKDWDKPFAGESYWARVCEVEPGIDWQRLKLRSQELFPGSRWLPGSPVWAEDTVGSIKCILKRRSR